MASPAPAGPERPADGKVAETCARILVSLRWWVIGFWLAVTVLSLVVLPGGAGGGGNGLKGLLSLETPSVRTELRSVNIFGYPLLARTVLVQRDPDGLSAYAQARTVTRAVAADRHAAGDLAPLEGALPLTNTFGLFPGSAEHDTTALTYLLFRPEVTLGAQTRAAHRYATRFFTARDHVVGVSGSVPARAAQGDIIDASLPRAELATLLSIVLIVGISFRSVVTPVVTLVTAGVAQVVTLTSSAWLVRLLDIASPSELEPVVVALLLGVVTDYVVFFCAAMRHEVDTGVDGLTAARRATARFGPIVGVAGLAVAAGTAALVVATSPFFRALGPALLFTVLCGLLVAVTLVPALMAVLGRWTFWPTGRRSRVPAPITAAPVAAIVRHRRVALGVVVACVSGLLVAAVPLLRLQLGVSFVSSLPENTSVREAADSAEAGFAPGILSPTLVLLQGDGITGRRAALVRFGDRLAAQPGVAGVLGPGSVPFPSETGVLLAHSGDAARYLVILDSDPLGATAISAVDSISDSLPAALAASGLPRTTAGLGGDTATAAYIVDQTTSDLLRIALTAMAANLLMLIIFLRAVIASLALLAASLLSLAATFGLTTLLFNHLYPGLGLTFYVPFATAVLLLAFGSDYNIFSVGQVWHEARHSRLDAAITTVLPRTIRTLATAGLALAASFGWLALVPLTPFRQLAFAMGVGIVLDVVVVRSLLMPAMLRLFGPISGWPSRILHDNPDDVGAS